MATNSLHELYVQQLQDLYDAEHQIINALPKMIEAVESEELRSALTEHLEITKTQAERIERICEEMDEDAESQECKGMRGVIQEGNDHVKQAEDYDARDAVIIAAAQRVEHYEIAGYGTARTYANLLGYDDAANLLQRTLDEEKEADAKLTGIAETLNVEAMQAGEEVEEAATERARAGEGSTRSRSSRGKHAA